MPDVGRRVPRWKILLGVFLVASCLLAFWAVWGYVAGERHWKAMERQVEETLREAVGRSGERPVLRGNAEPGNAWNDYEPALDSIGQFEWYVRGWKDVQQFRDGDKAASREKVRETIDAHRGSLLRLRQGTRRERANYVFVWQKGSSMKTPSRSGATALAALATCEARLLLEQGKGSEAADLLLDIGQFSRDFASAGQSFGEGWSDSILGEALRGLQEVLRSGNLTPERLLQIDRELEILDRPRRGNAEPIGVMELAIEFLEAPNLYASLRQPRCMCLEHVCPPWGGWLYGFSDRLMAANAFEKALAWSKQLSAAAEATRFAEAKAIQDPVWKQVSSEFNPIVHSHVQTCLAMTDGHWEQRARMRLLRIAAHRQATGEMLDLEDPFGARIRSQKVGGSFRIWSVGRDGVDDGGKGGFRGSDSKDIVLDLER